MQTITAQQSRNARRELGLSQANVTKELNFNRQYLSEFETGFSTRLTKTQLKKLRTFYEDKITEANEGGEGITLTFGTDEESEPLFSLEKEERKRLTFTVGSEVSDELLRETEDIIKNNDKRLLAHLSADVLKNEGFLADGELLPETLENLRESFALLSANYLLIRSLTGWPEFGLSAGNISPATNTVFSLMVTEFVKQFPQVTDSFEMNLEHEGVE